VSFFLPISWTLLTRIARPSPQDVIIISDDDSPPPTSKRPSFAPLPRTSISARTGEKGKDGEKEGLDAVRKQGGGRVHGGRDERNQKEDAEKGRLRDTVPVSSKPFLALGKRLTPFSDPTTARSQTRSSANQDQCCGHAFALPDRPAIPNISSHDRQSCFKRFVFPPGTHDSLIAMCRLADR
jgi:hypothetical protein